MARRSMRLSNVLASRKSVVTLPREVLKVGRNDPCICGSGAKFKDCCAPKGTAYLEKLRRKQHKQHLKEQGVPWYLRILG